MKYIVAPETIGKDHQYGPYVFMCGGITGCADWQQEFRKLMEGTNIGTLLNPRQDNFDVTDPDAAKAQITWEFNALWDAADVYIFWFTKDTIQPIVLFELGARLAGAKFGKEMDIDMPIFIGIEPGYTREQDVRIQTELVDPTIPIVDTLEQLANLTKPFLRGWKSVEE